MPRSAHTGRTTDANILGLGQHLLAKAKRKEVAARRKLLKALARRNAAKAQRWEGRLRKRTIRLGVLRRLYARDLPRA